MSTASIDRRVRREARLLLREARRGLRGGRATGHLSVGARSQLGTGADELEKACQQNDMAAMRAGIVGLDPLVDEHLGNARKSTVREYAESIGIAVLIALGLRACVVEAFKIPSGSMIPTMEIGDHIFVNKFLYGIRVPFTNWRLMAVRKPHRGEVVVFVYPCEPEKDFIKRIVALAGDTIEVRCDVLYINGKKAKQELVPGECRYDDLVNRDDPQMRLKSDHSEAKEPDAWASRRCSRYRNRLGDYTFDTMYDADRPTRDARPTPQDFPRGAGAWSQISRAGEQYIVPSCGRPSEPGRTAEQSSAAAGKIIDLKAGQGSCKQRYQYVVPPGHVFVMGDNRDQSSDSRFWGPVPLGNIKGKALFIWWASRPDYSRSSGGSPVSSDTRRVQFGRIGKLVH